MHAVMHAWMLGVEMLGHDHTVLSPLPCRHRSSGSMACIAVRAEVQQMAPSQMSC
jgi:hypothetical protein